MSVYLYFRCFTWSWSVFNGWRPTASLQKWHENNLSLFSGLGSCCLTACARQTTSTCLSLQLLQWYSHVLRRRLPWKLCWERRLHPRQPPFITGLHGRAGPRCGNPSWKAEATLTPACTQTKLLHVEGFYFSTGEGVLVHIYPLQWVGGMDHFHLLLLMHVL